MSLAITLVHEHTMLRCSGCFVSLPRLRVFCVSRTCLRDKAKL